MGKEKLVLILALVVVILGSSYVYSQANYVSPPSIIKEEISNSPPQNGQAKLAPSCSNQKSDFTDEWKTECKKQCDHAGNPSDCYKSLDKQTTIKWCKPNAACLDAYKKATNLDDGNQYVCGLDQSDSDYTALLFCPSCVGPPPITIPLISGCECKYGLAQQ